MVRHPVALVIAAAALSHTSLAQAGEQSALTPTAAPEGLVAQIDKIAAALAVTDYELVTPAIHRTGVRTVISLELPDETFTLDLLPAEIRARDFRAVRIDAEGREHEVDTSDIITLQGRSLDHDGSAAAATLVGDSVRAFIRLTDGSVWAAQPLSSILPGANATTVVVYRNDDLLPQQLTCGVVGHNHDHAGDAPNIGTRGTAFCPDYESTIELTADTTFFNQEGVNTESRLMTIMNAVDLIYQRDLSVTFDLIGIRTFTAGDPWPVNFSGSEAVHPDLLNAFDSWVSGVAPISGTDRDCAHLASGHNFTGSTIGFAGVGSICTGNPATGINQMDHSDTVDISLLAHELGHNFGSDHDGDGNACSSSGNIMAPSNGGAQVFSSCSIAQITPNLTRSCFTNLTGTVGGFAAIDDSYTTATDTSRIMDVLANELQCINGVPGSPGSVSVPPTSAQGGILSVQGIGPDGRDVVRYEPPAGHVGSDSFVYTLNGDTASDTATVSIDVRATLEPTVCDLPGNVTYESDLGSFNNAFGWSPGIGFMWMKQFTVQPGAETIAKVEIGIGSFGAGGMIGIWDDPNNDGNVADAVLIAQIGPISFPDNFTTYEFAFPLTNVGSAGDSFFVGAGGTSVSGEFPVGRDGQASGGRSFTIVSPFGDVPGGFVQIEGDLGNWVVRAIGGTFADCNENGLIDACEIAEICQPDTNDNGVIDDCEELPTCLCEYNGNSEVDVSDLLSFLALWFVQDPGAEVDGNPGVDVSDLLTFLACWFEATGTGTCP